MIPSDEALVPALRRGDGSAFRILYERHKDRMLRLARRITGCGADAEDAVQDAFLAIFEKVKGFDGRASLRTWIYRIVVNASLQVRRRRREAAPMDAPPPVVPPEDMARAEAVRVLDRAVQDLPLRQRAVFSLHVVEGFSLGEAAAILEIAPGTARYHLHAARRRLQARMVPYVKAPAGGGDGTRTSHGGRGR